MPNAFRNTEGDLRLWMDEVPLSIPHRMERLTLFFLRQLHTRCVCTRTQKVELWVTLSVLVHM